MGQKNEDRFLDEIDAELRSVNKRLRKTFSDVQVLLGEFSDQGDEADRVESCAGGQETAEQCMPKIQKR